MENSRYTIVIFPTTHIHCLRCNNHNLQFMKYYYDNDKVITEYRCNMCYQLIRDINVINTIENI